MTWRNDPMGCVTVRCARSALIAGVGVESSSIQVARSWLSLQGISRICSRAEQGGDQLGIDNFQLAQRRLGQKRRANDFAW